MSAATDSMQDISDKMKQVTSGDVFDKEAVKVLAEAVKRIADQYIEDARAAAHEAFKAQAEAHARSVESDFN